MTDPTDDRSLDRWRAAFAARPLGDSPEGSDSEAGDSETDPETVWRAVRGELPEDETRALVDRLVDDPALALEWRLAREMDRQSQIVGEAGDGPASGAEPSAEPLPFDAGRTRRHAPRHGLQPWLALAATLALAVVGLLVFRPGVGGPSTDPGPDPVWRAGGNAIESALDADAVLPRDDAVLRWRGLDDEGVVYRVDVLTESLEPLVSVDELEEPRLRLEPEVLADLPPESAVLWRVTATLGDDEIASPTFRTPLGPPNP